MPKIPAWKRELYGRAAVRRRAGTLAKHPINDDGHKHADNQKCHGVTYRILGDILAVAAAFACCHAADDGTKKDAVSRCCEIRRECLDILNTIISTYATVTLEIMCS